jgi:hypothetical protein
LKRLLFAMRTEEEKKEIDKKRDESMGGAL